MARGRQDSSEASVFANRSYRNILYGAATVMVLFIAAFLGLNLLQKAGMLGEPGISTEQTVEEKTYTVQEGDTLWSISQKLYNDSYAWPTLAAANRIQSPDAIEEGMKLVVPDGSEEIALVLSPTPTKSAAPTEVATPTLKPTAIPTKINSPVKSDAPAGSKGAATGTPSVPSGMSKITGNSYTVVEGDNLWNIAVRRYGDGYKWVEIAKANKLVNPDLIHPGNKFKLPR